MNAVDNVRNSPVNLIKNMSRPKQENSSLLLLFYSYKRLLPCACKALQFVSHRRHRISPCSRDFLLGHCILYSDCDLKYERDNQREVLYQPKTFASDQLSVNSFKSFSPKLFFEQKHTMNSEIIISVTASSFQAFLYNQRRYVKHFAQTTSTLHILTQIV